ncbi:unnamed protein product [Oikopleura dioica]|uniref:ZP domain-containing protein n=1 Tax=Oikopleura dioica TaxID=34765 RepID=E4XZD3_OIKDI|nr:unnamed protein product [Oikopleura dioica]
MIFFSFLILFGQKSILINALTGRVKRGATINCDIVIVDCNLDTIEISLNETCREQEYQVIPSSGAGLFVTSSKFFNTDLDLQSPDERRSCVFNTSEINNEVELAPSLPDITPCVDIAEQSFSGEITSSGWLHFSPVEVEFEIKLMEPVQIECYFDSILNLDEEEISISEADVTAVKEEIKADQIIKRFRTFTSNEPI